MKNPAYAASIDEVLKNLESDTHHGLSASEVALRQTRDGFNELQMAPAVPWWRKLAAQFTGLVIWILIVAAIISGALGEWVDTGAILAIVLLNGLLGFFQEERAERALSALQELSPPLTKVKRDGKLQSLPARELVVGDHLELEAGDKIPADARLMTAFGLRAQEASLTGESVPTEKVAAIVLAPDAALGDRRNMVYMGTVAAAGKASAVVVATGMNTELGHIAGMLEQAEREPTPLQRRLSELGRTLVFVCLAIVAVIFTLEIVRGGKPWEVFMVSVSLAVAAVPEGLPAVVTVALALGLQRMAKRNALVRKLPSVETLGAVTVICSDKTGTLTRNEMTVRNIWTSFRRYRVTGTGYTPHGDFYLENGDVRESKRPSQDADLELALTVGALCNNSHVTQSKENADKWQVIGDPTEGALIVLAMKGKTDPRAAAPELLDEIPFDSDRKMMSVVMRDQQGNVTLYSKGAPEVIVRACQAILENGKSRPLTDQDRKAIDEENRRLASDAQRVLALAYRPHLNADNAESGEQNLVFVGLIGMLDPPREEAKEAVRKCHAAGIRPVMITGDHPETALAIARELHIAKPDGRVVEGRELDSMSDEDLEKKVDQYSVYARVSAAHKLRVVNAWKKRGQIVAMTGDGVNDAPAVKAADIGIVMGITGTDVSKEAADMVLTDDNFASIVNAVEEGRGIFDNIQKFLYFLLSSNTSEVLFMFIAALIGWPVPLWPIQILWINLVTDSLPALALAMETPERDIMHRPPRPAREAVITLNGGLRILFHGGLLAAASMTGFAIVYNSQTENLAQAQTVAFCVLTFTQIFFSLACRSQRATMPQLGLFTNPTLLLAMLVAGILQLGAVLLPFAQPIFRVTSIEMWHWGLIAGLSLAPVTVIEIIKILQSFARGR